MSLPTFIFDFDSTLVSIESLDELIGMSLRRTMQGQDLTRAMEKIHAITSEGMEGKIDLRTSINRRLSVAHPHRRDLEELQEMIVETIVPGMDSIIRSIHDAGASAYIVSGALMDLIEPVAKILGIPPDRCFANTGIFDGDVLVDVAPGPLTSSTGKTQVMRDLRVQGTISGAVVMVGDGASDLHPYREKAADHFIGVGIFAVRPSVEENASVFIRTVADLDRAIHSFLSL